MKKLFYIITMGVLNHSIPSFIIFAGHQPPVSPPNSAQCNLQAARPGLQMPTAAQGN